MCRPDGTQYALNGRTNVLFYFALRYLYKKKDI